jgi:hypothetical protein
MATCLYRRKRRHLHHSGVIAAFLFLFPFLFVLSITCAVPCNLPSLISAFSASADKCGNRVHAAIRRGAISRLIRTPTDGTWGLNWERIQRRLDTDSLLPELVVDPKM